MVRLILKNRILIVDDSIIFTNALAYHLLYRNFEVEICYSYNDYQNNINIDRFDLILLDMKLKDGDGLEILQHILREDLNKKVIMLSSYLNNKNILEAKAFGVYMCIEKNSDLFNKLDSILDSIKECI